MAKRRKSGPIPSSASREPKGWARRAGVPDAVDGVAVQHVSGGRSTLGFKSYDQGRAKWQAETLDFVWFDEEPPMDLYTEGLTRTNATQGIVWLTFADTHPPHVSPRRQARRRRTDTT